MTPAKRILDFLFACLAVLLLAPAFVWLIVLIWVRQGRPIFYVAERMKTPTQSFGLWKFRTMTVAPKDQGVSGGNKEARITPLGARMRRLRVDEFPQLWNILRGDLSFVGPRPPLREYVEKHPGIYREVLRSRPGVTGLASIVFHEREESLLKNCATSEETEQVYSERCIPRKAQLDLIYQRNRTICYDFALVYQTFVNFLGKKR